MPLYRVKTLTYARCENTVNFGVKFGQFEDLVYICLKTYNRTMKITSVPYYILATLAILTTGCKRSTIDDRLELEAQETTLKNCPQDIGGGIIQDSMVYKRGERAMYYYLSIDLTKEQQEMLDDKIWQENRETVLNRIRTNIPMKKAKENGIAFVYLYYLKEPYKLIHKDKFTQKDYQ